MAESERSPMSEAEQAVLKVLRDHGPLDVRDVLLRITEACQKWSRSTVITRLQRLENEGDVHSDQSPFAFVFAAAVPREDEMLWRMDALAGELCDGEALSLMLTFTPRRDFSAEELVAPVR